MPCTHPIFVEPDRKHRYEEEASSYDRHGARHNQLAPEHTAVIATT